jgi:hypothetical protein
MVSKGISAATRLLYTNHLPFTLTSNWIYQLATSPDLYNPFLSSVPEREKTDTFEIHFWAYMEDNFEVFNSTIIKSAHTRLPRFY